MRHPGPRRRPGAEGVAVLSGATRMERGRQSAINLAKHISKTAEQGKRQTVRVNPGRGVSGKTLEAQMRSL